MALVAATLTVQLNQLQKTAEILEMLKVQPHFQGPQGAAASSSTAAPACGLSDDFINTEYAHVSHEPMTPAAPAAPAVALAMDSTQVKLQRAHGIRSTAVLRHCNELQTIESVMPCICLCGYSF